MRLALLHGALGLRDCPETKQTAPGLRDQRNPEPRGPKGRMRDRGLAPRPWGRQEGNPAQETWRPGQCPGGGRGNQ